MTTSTKIIQYPKISPRDDIKPPPLFDVIYINDHTTTMEFVVETLKIYFDYDDVTAEGITIKIHEDGSAVVATLPYEIAEQKGVEITLLARKNGFPLVIKLEPTP
jgi:ATP-dependent Clp protease adaptor protein ClpS